MRSGMSGSASNSGIDSNAPNVTEEMESEVKSGSVTPVKKPQPTKAELQTGLKNWSASSVKLNAADSEREYKYPEPPEWECIICSKPINTTPVYQCQSGHLACFSCSQNGINCRLCSKAGSRIKNLAVENMINSLVVTCKFAKLGCNEVIEFKCLEWSEHENNCSFMPIFCPMPGCKQAGLKNLLAQHLLSEHKINFLVDMGESYLFSDYRYNRNWDNSIEFDLDSSTTMVMLRHMHRDVPSQDFHLLHQQNTAMGDRLQITSPGKTCKRKYELDVKISEELTYCFKSVCTSDIQPAGGLLIPKQPGGDTPKKRWKVRMPRQ